MKRLRMLWNYEYQVEFIVLIRRFILDKTSFVKAWLCLISHSVKNHNSSNWYILLPRSINIVERLGFCAEKDLTSHKRGEKLILGEFEILLVPSDLDIDQSKKTGMTLSDSSNQHLCCGWHACSLHLDQYMFMFMVISLMIMVVTTLNVPSPRAIYTFLAWMKGHSVPNC